ncbi:MAG: NAD(+)/NADH kinase [Desulfovibrio sp.]|uniref:NAD(+)/NADH kinase n=1 Tax=Desulfovibrio sp. TaxID=885 RepID=UPI001A763FCA|nr:NAD(+)/NADH kinase [Desulfovibrio sp.]MBD5417575.1 NAD(+)/NADH kinase [Desulfovibrio sp.]
MCVGEQPDVLVVFKARHAKARALGREVVAWLEARGLVARLCESGGARCEAGADLADDRLPRPGRCVIVLGGDGTILGVARHFAFSGIPLFGINFGRVGFLTTADPANWQERLEMALAPGTPAHSCLALRWEVMRDGRQFSTGVAVNDVVVGRGALARLMGLGVTVDGRPMGVLRCDGLVCSSPVGSSGYSASAGGPIIFPGMDAIGLTPICPCAGGVAPLMLPGATVCRVSVGAATEAWLTVDGQEGLLLQGGDEVLVSGAPDGVRFLGGVRFFEKLRVRGFALDADVCQGE